MSLFLNYQRVLAGTALLFSLIATPALSSCDSRICVAGCGTFDARFQFCNFDHQVFSSLEACVCISGSGDFEQSLLNCLSCNGKVLGTHNAATYEKWAIICGEYEVQGEQAAIALENGPYESMNSFYLSSVIPAVTSLCPANFESAAATTTSLVTTTPVPLTSSSSSSILPVSTTSSPSTIIPVMTTSSTSTSTPVSITSQTSTSSTTDTTSSAAITQSISPAAAAATKIPVAYMALVLGLAGMMQ